MDSTVPFSAWFGPKQLGAEILEVQSKNNNDNDIYNDSGFNGIKKLKIICVHNSNRVAR